MDILIVEANEAMRDILSTIITVGSKKRVNIIECKDGESGLASFMTHKPALVLMDAELRSGDAFDLAKEMRRVEPHVRLLLLCSYDTPFIRNKALSLNVTALIPKDQLSAINQYLNHA